MLMLSDLFVLGVTFVSSIPLAEFMRNEVWFLKYLCIFSGLHIAKSFIVSIPSSLNFAAVLFPTMNKSPTGSGHIFFIISSLYRVWTLSGFSKSEAILAQSLLFPMPTLTVNPKFIFISFFIFSANVS